MASFGFFGETEHRVFNYKPVYYDKEKEELRKKFGKVDGRDAAAPDGKYVPGSYIRGSLTTRHSEKSIATKAQKIIGMVGLALVFIVLYYIAKFYTLL